MLIGLIVYGSPSSSSNMTIFLPFPVGQKYRSIMGFPPVLGSQNVDCDHRRYGLSTVLSRGAPAGMRCIVALNIRSGGGTRTGRLISAGPGSRAARWPPWTGQNLLVR